VKSDAERIGELEVEVQILDNRIGALEFGHQALQSNLRALRSELEQNRTIGTPVRSTTLRTIDAVPAGHPQGHCTRCDGYHPIAGADA